MFHSKFFFFGFVSFLTFVLLACDGSVSEQATHTSVAMEPPPQPFEVLRSNLGRTVDLQTHWNLVGIPIDADMAVDAWIAQNSDYSIQSIWSWNPDLETETGDSGAWMAYPQLGTFELLETLSPNKAYWLKASFPFTMTGEGKAQRDYLFNEGWNLVSIDYQANRQIPETFFSTGNFWNNDCNLTDLVENVWAWNGNWSLYFPGDTATSQPGLDAFNALHQSNFAPLLDLEAGTGIWVQAKKTTDPVRTHCSKMLTQNLGTQTEFQLPEDTISFALHAFGPSSFEALSITSLTNPSGEDIAPHFPKALTGYGFVSALTPSVPGKTSPAGLWRFQSEGVIDHKLTIRTGTTPDNATISVQGFLHNIGDANYTVEDVSQALAILKTTYENSGINIQLEDVQVIGVVNDSTELFEMGEADRLNVLFFADMLTPHGLGKAAGIPGSLGVKGSQNWVMVNMVAHEIGNQLNTQLLGETTAHEMGHQLGLFHTSNETGDFFDPLDDTLECHLSSRTAQACAGFDGNNLMFWQGDDAVEQTTLSADQATIIRHSPLAK